VLTSRGRYWYVVGFDRDRQARRSFRLSRVEGGIRRIGPDGSYDVPQDADADVELVAFAPDVRDERVAELRVRAGRAVLLRQRALSAAASDEPGWDAVRVPVRDVPDLAHEIAGYGPDVVALQPADVRAAVVRVLSAALSAASYEAGERVGS
jgi:proteasome accessory factor B